MNSSDLISKEEMSLLRSIKIAVSGDEPIVRETHLHIASYQAEQLFHGELDKTKTYETRELWGGVENCPYSPELHETIESLISKGYLSRDGKDSLELHVLKLLE